ncbi:MAG: PepSY-associated TM helix domain-containing protein [Pseudomonadota bacterium]
MTSRTEKRSSGEGSNNRFVRQMIDSHSVLGLSFAALIYIVSLSGALTLFVSEISLWELPDTPAAHATTPQAVAAAAHNAEAELKDGNEIVNVVAYGPDEFRPYLAVRLNQRAGQGAPLESTDWIADPQTGELLSVAEAPYAHLIEDLHTVLLLPNPWGRYLVGIIGVCMFTLILSGIFAHPTIVKDAFKLRLKRNARMAWTDVHNRLSVWGLPFHLVITFTGAFLGVAGITVVALAMLAYEGDQEAAIQVIQGPQPVLDAPLMTAPPDYASMLERSAAPDRDFSLLVAGNPKNSGYTTSVAYYEEGILSSRTSDVYRNSGEFLEKFGGSGSPAGARVFGMVQPLHYGTFGGYPIKILYFVLSLALTYITSSGMMIWFKRKQQQGNPKPGTEALWRGMTTGLSAALVATALVTVANLQVPLLPAFLAVWLACLALITTSRNPVRWVRYHYMAIATVLAVVAAMHFPSALAASAAAKPLLIGIDLSLLLAALAFLAAAFRAQPEGNAGDSTESEINQTAAGSRVTG